MKAFYDIFLLPVKSGKDETFKKYAIQDLSFLNGM